MRNIAFILMITVMLTIFSGCQSMINRPGPDLAAGQGELPDSSIDADEDIAAEEHADVEEPVGAEEPADEETPASGQIIDKGGQQAEENAPAGFAYNVIKYEILDNIPDELAALVEEKKISAAAEVIKEEADYKIVFISLGERSTGGYSIEITEVADIENGKATVRYREVTPAPDAMVTQAITYPYVVLRIETNLPVVFAE